MTSDLSVPLLCCCAILKVHSFEDGVFSISFFDMQHGLLYSFFLGQLLFFLLVFGFQSGIVGKKVKLLELPLGGGSRGFLDHMAYGDVQPPDQKVFVNNPVEQFSGGVHDPFGRGSEASQRDGAMGVLGYLPTIGILHNFAVIGFPAEGIGEVFHVVTDGNDQLIGDKAFVHQIRERLSAISRSTSLAFSAL